MFQHVRLCLTYDLKIFVQWQPYWWCVAVAAAAVVVVVAFFTKSKCTEKIAVRKKIYRIFTHIRSDNVVLAFLLLFTLSLESNQMFSVENSVSFYERSEWRFTVPYRPTDRFQVHFWFSLSSENWISMHWARKFEYLALKIDNGIVVCTTDASTESQLWNRGAFLCTHTHAVYALWLVLARTKSLSILVGCREIAL